MSSLSVIILAGNEAGRIGPALLSAAGAEEILVIDDHSSDGTKELAEAAGARVIRRALAGDYAAQRNFASREARGDWLFYLDADERLNPALMTAIRAFMESGPQRAGVVRRVNYAFGRRHRFGVLRPDLVARLFPRNQVVWKGAVHEAPVSELPLQRLAGRLEHFTYESWAAYFDKFNRYTTIWAEEAFNKGQKAGWLKLAARPAWAFFKVFLLNGGIWDGPVAWALCYYHFGYTLAKYLKLRERWNKLGDEAG